MTTQQKPTLTLMVCARTSSMSPAMGGCLQQPCWDCKQAVWVSPYAQRTLHQGVICTECATARGHVVAPDDQVAYFFERREAVADAALAAQRMGYGRLCLVCLQGFNEGACPRCPEAEQGAEVDP